MALLRLPRAEARAAWLSRPRSTSDAAASFGFQRRRPAGRRLLSVTLAAQLALPNDARGRPPHARGAAAAIRGRPARENDGLAFDRPLVVASSRLDGYNATERTVRPGRTFGKVP